MIITNKLVQSMFLPALPTRALGAHKGNFGSVAIIGGDTGMVGAVLLAARAALFCGAGRVYATFLAANAPNVDTCHPEIMLHSAATLTNLSALNCVVIGTGLGQSKAAIDLIVDALIGINLRWFVGGLFVLSMFSLSGGIVCFLREVHIAMLSLRNGSPKQSTPLNFEVKRL